MKWSINSWQGFPIKQVPEYKDKKVIRNRKRAF